MSALFSPLTSKDITFRNRIGVSPMCQYSSTDGIAQDWHMVQLGSFAVGGAGLIIAEATAVSPEGRISPRCAGLWNSQQVEALIPINRFITQHGAVPGIQLAHSGRKGSAARPWEGGQHLDDNTGGWPIIGPADQPFDPDGKRLWKSPRQMSKNDIKIIQQEFADSAKRALEAGYQLLELHGAHGYLLHSFFTPLVNTRDDEYGGNTRNRARMMLETVDGVRAVWPENLPLAVRLSTHDWVDGGLELEDNIQMTHWLKEHGVDFVDCSSGGANPTARTPFSNRPSKQIGLAAEIRKATSITTMAVGEITKAKQAEDIITNGQADIVLLARQIMRDPYWAIHAAQELGVDTKHVLPDQMRFFVG